MSQKIMSAAVYWTERAGLQLKGKWNSGERCSVWRHAKRHAWSNDASC